MPTNGLTPQTLLHTYQEMPVGSVIAFAGNLQHVGKANRKGTNLGLFNWLLCDGQSIQQAQYPELFSVLGYTYGGSTSKGTFRVPNYQGTFLRGVDHDDCFNGSNEHRESPSNGDKLGVGSTQDFAMQSHTHYYQKPTAGVTVPSESSAGVVASQVRIETSEPSANIGPISQNETRPVNTYVYWLIKTSLSHNSQLTPSSIAPVPPTPVTSQTPDIGSNPGSAPSSNAHDNSGTNTNVNPSSNPHPNP